MTKRNQILEQAVTYAEEVGIQSIRRNQLADRLKIARGSLAYHFGAMDNLRNEIVRHAIESENIVVIGKAIGEGHPLTREISDDLKQRSLATLI